MARYRAWQTAIRLGLPSALFMLAGSASAASFDCGKAKAPDEIAVCRTPALSMRDSEMGGLWYAYSRVPMMMGSSGARRDDAQAFLQQRSVCGANAGCLARVYDARIKALRAGIDGAMQVMLQLQNG